MTNPAAPLAEGFGVVRIVVFCSSIAAYRATLVLHLLRQLRQAQQPVARLVR
jgi:hypothetical protein